MTTRRDRELPPGLDVLLREGSAVGLTDGQLLECFATRDREAAELAFAVLVERHGPMVLRTCLAVLRDEHDAQDAFQAVFLILARRGGSLRVWDSIGPWLHRVARRAAIRLGRDAERRRSVEQGACWPVERSSRDAGDAEIAAVVHEEVDRLPERYRVPIVLCDLDGRTHEEAARHLGCPVGTVKSRLARGRDRLRDRLTRRGLAPGMAVAAPLRASMPAVLADSTARLATAGAVAVPGPIVGVIRDVSRSMFLAHLGSLTMKLAVGLAIGIGLVLIGASVRARPAPAEKPPAPAVTEARPAAPEFAWRRKDRYEPPDFARYFPDDPEGGKVLDRLWEDEGRRAKLTAAEILPIVRRGLRRTTAPLEQVVGWVGQRFIWEASPQDPLAIEMLYHATDHRGPVTGYGESPSIYYGLMRVEPKTPAILHALVDWCIHVENTMDWQWAGWIGRKHRSELASYLKPYLDSGDEATRKRAVVVGKFLSEDPDQYKAYRAWAAEIVRAKSGHRLAGVEKTLRTGTSRERLDAMKLVFEERLYYLIDESFADAFRACARDKDPAVRRESTRTLGLFTHNDPSLPWTGTAVDILLDLSKDPDARTRYDAVYHGLTSLPTAHQEAVIRRLVEMAMFDRQSDLPGRIKWGLQHETDAAARILDEALRGPDPGRAEAARAVYQELTGRTPPNVQAASPEVRKGYVRAFRDLYEHLGKVYPSFAVKGIDWLQVGRELLPRADAVETQEPFGLLVEELVARLEDSHAFVQPGTATPPRTPGLPEWDAWLACLIDDRGRPVLYSVSPRTPAWQAGVRPGMTVLSVNGVPAAEAIDRWMRLQSRYVGYSSERYMRYDAARVFHRQTERGARIALELEDVDGRTLGVALTAEVRGWYIPRLPVPRRGIQDGGADVQWVRLDDGIGYISVRRIRPGLEVSLDQALTALGEMKGLILDVRGNSGGGFDETTAFQNFNPAAGGEAAPHHPHYEGPIALLIDERCISAGEGWASWFVARKRARLFGTATAGASARKEIYTLSNGLYKVQVPVKAYTGFLDRPIERRGLEPDVPVRCTAADIARGRDTVAEAAIDWLKQATSPPVENGGHPR